MIKINPTCPARHLLIPRFNSQGIDLACLWQPTLEYGKTITVQSSITPACGTWIIHSLEYDLESQTPNGRWFCNILAYAPGSAPVS